MDDENALALLNEIKCGSEVMPPHSHWVINRLVELGLFAIRFKSSGQYREAKYTASAFLSAATDNDSEIYRRLKIADLKAYFLEFETLPDQYEIVDRRPVRPGTPAQESGPYKEAYPPGCAVCVKDKHFLLDFAVSWKFHHPVTDEHLKFAGQCSFVRDVSFYHGGDALYNLADTGKLLWHESCLEIWRRK